MDIYGINNIEIDNIKFNYDKYYRNIALKLKSINNVTQINEVRRIERKILSESNNINIELNVLKNNFMKLILDENSSQYLWILYSKYSGEENYIDKISDILKRENSIIRGGTNTYKMNGWMAHTLYVYQIINENIAKNKELINFNGDYENKCQVNELHEIYKELDRESQFILKIFALIHDIGVIEDIKFHPEIGVKYVEKVLEEIGLTNQELKENNIQINLNDLICILKILVNYHILITCLSTEGSDKYVEESYRDLINNIPDLGKVKNNIPKILFIFAYGDVIAVDESLMDVEKYNRIKDGYCFFEAITQDKIPIRDKEQVAIQRICDTVGKIKYIELKNKLDEILVNLNINKNQFINNMYDLRLLRYTGPLMKTLSNIEISIKIYNEIFELITILDSKDAIKDYVIIFVPDKHEDYFVKQFKNGNFFKCVDLMKNTKDNVAIYDIVKIERGKNNTGKYLYISIV